MNHPVFSHNTEIQHAIHVDLLQSQQWRPRRGVDPVGHQPREAGGPDQGQEEEDLQQDRGSQETLSSPQVSDNFVDFLKVNCSIKVLQGGAKKTQLS